MTHRNADTRLRDAFASLRSEIETTFNVKLTEENADDNEPLRVLDWLEDHEEHLHWYAKLPADA